MAEQLIKKAVIPAAGLGTRFLPATKAMPKEMMPIVDKPTIQYIIEEAVDSGITDILIITGRGKRAIEDHFDKSYELAEELAKKGNYEMIETLKKIELLADIHYIRQREPLGLGHAVLRAKSHVGNEPFAVFLGDDLVKSKVPCIKKMIELFGKYRSPIIAVSPVEKKEISKYGVIKAKMAGDVFVIEDLVEKPPVEKAPSNLAILGRYILVPEIFDILEKIPPAKSGEITLTDGLRTLNKSIKLFAYKIDGKWLTVGDRITYLKAVIEYALERPDVGKELREYLKKIV